MASIRKARNKQGGGYEIDYTDPFTGKRKRKVFRGTLKEAEFVAKELEIKRYRISNGIESPIRSNIQISELIDKYKYSINKTKNPKTVKREMLTLSSFLEHIGSRKLSTIKPGDIQRYVEVRLDSGLSPHTINLDLRNLKVFFNYAVKNLFIERNPINGVSWLKAPPKVVRFLSKDEIKRLFLVIDDDDFKNLIMTYLSTGARRDEILPPRFTWDNVDFEGGQLRLFGKRDKTRWIPMSTPVRQALEDLQEKGRQYPFEYTPDHVSYKLGAYYKLAGIKKANVHVLRKTFGSMMIQNKIADIYVVSKLLGHSSVRVTESHYVELLKENVEEPIEDLAKLLPKN